MTAQGCDWMDEVAAELALGLLEGAERAEALAHAEKCGACQAEVASLTTVGERLLLLAPEVPPPAGFETRVLERIASAPERLRALGRSGADSSDRQPLVKRRWRRLVRDTGDRARPAGRRNWVMAAVAAIVVAVLAGGFGAGLFTDEPSQITAPMLSNRSGKSVGDATLFSTDPLTVEVEAEEWIVDLKEAGHWVEGQWWLTVRDEDGDKDLYKISFADSPAEVTLDFHSDSGPLEFGDVTEVALMDHNGKEWCTARFD